MPLNKHATKIQLKKLLEENNITKTSDNIMTLMMIVIEHGLIDRDSCQKQKK